MLATWGILIATTFQVTVGWLIWRKVETMHKLVFVITLIFGSMTLLFQDDVFIKWRPSIISFALSGVLLVGHFMQRNLLQRLCESMMISGLGRVLPIERRVWQQLNAAFVLYLSGIALLNLYIAFNFSTDFWVSFKLFGFTAIQIVFYISVLFYAVSKLPEHERKALFAQEESKQGTSSDTDSANKSE